jgi:hypothetical protein
VLLCSRTRGGRERPGRGECRAPRLGGQALGVGDRMEHQHAPGLAAYGPAPARAPGSTSLADATDRLTHPRHLAAASTATAAAAAAATQVMAERSLVTGLRGLRGAPAAILQPQGRTRAVAAAAHGSVHVDDEALVARLVLGRQGMGLAK